MRNYKVKAKDLYVGMEIYHVEGTGAYFGAENIIVRISKTPNMNAKDEIGAKPAGEIRVFTKSKNGIGVNWLKPDDIVYPVINVMEVTILTKLKWRLRWLYYSLFNKFIISKLLWK